MDTIKGAFRASPMIAAFVTFIMGASMALAIVGVVVPAVTSLIIQILLALMLGMGVIYWHVTRKDRVSANPFGLPRLLVSLTILTGSRKHSLVWATT